MMKKMLFGTDGIRGSTDSALFLPESVERLGSAVAMAIKNFSSEEIAKNDKRPFIILGRDTRASGIYLEEAFVKGVTSQGIDCHLVGVLPTSGVAYLAREYSALVGVMISASHNQSFDNGFKFFDSFGFKIDDEFENTIEKNYINFAALGQKANRSLGQISTRQDAASAYIRHLLGWHIHKPQPIRFKIVVDCAHGAASTLVSHIFSSSWIDATFIGVSPNGHNINFDCGSENPRSLREEVLKQNANLGVGFDGDADRVLFIDERGEAIDGDAVLAVMARDFKRNKRLAHDTVVATVMSSVALDNALAPYKIQVKRTEVGDKFVARAMRQEGLSFGGENSGHLIRFPETTTGDGIYSALQFLDLMQRERVAASELIKLYRPMPYLLKNIEVRHKIPLDELPKTQALIERANEMLKSLGRVFLRYSGTENKLRILVEAPSHEECDKIANSILAEFLKEKAANL